MSGFRALLCMLAALVPGMVAPCPAQSPPAGSKDEARPAQPVRRIAESFTFEEPDNPYPVPQHWVLAYDTAETPRPGFPRFNQPSFDFEMAHTGRASVRLPTKGGSVRLRLQAGAIPVFPEGDYAVTGWVRTAGLTGARAFLVARLLDQDSKPIEGSEVRSAAMSTLGEWTEVAVQLVGTPGRAAFLQIDLELLQPRQLRKGSVDPHEALVDDLTGAAWFDDIVVYQLPRVELTTGLPSNIVVAPATPVLKILVRDFVGEKLDAQVVVRDVDNRVIQSARVALDASGKPQEWRPKLPRLGWYTVSLDVLGETATSKPYRVGRTDLDFIWLPSRASSPRRSLEQTINQDLDRFGILADAAEPDMAQLLAGVCKKVGSGFVSIPVWGDDIGRSSASQTLANIEPTLDALLAAKMDVRVCIPTVPRELAVLNQLAPSDPLGLTTFDQTLWMPYLQPVLDKYGQRVTHWQVGRIGTDDAFWRRNTTAATLKIEKILATLVPGPRVAIPWRAELELPHANAGLNELVIAFPAEFQGRLLHDYMVELNKLTAANGAKGFKDLTIVPELPDGDVFGQRAAVTELARRTVEFWAGATDGSGTPSAGVGLSMPWRRVGERRPQMMPAASLAAWRTLTAHLSGRKVLGECNLAPGLRCYILADRATDSTTSPRGALVAWNESAAPKDAVIRRFLGNGEVSVVDMFGNVATVEPDASGMHEVPVGETPVFIEGADPMVAQFCAALRVEPTFLPAIALEHELSLVLKNPWPVSISGKVQILPPSSSSGGVSRWTISPAGTISFALGPGQERRVPWTARFPSSEETGNKEIKVVVRLSTDRDLPPVQVSTWIEVGLKDLEMSPAVQLAPTIEGPDVIVTAEVSNRGERPRLLTLEALAPELPTQQSLISDLDPGESVVKRFVFKNAASKLSGRRIQLSLGDVDEAERLNMTVRVP